MQASQHSATVSTSGVRPRKYSAAGAPFEFYSSLFGQQLAKGTAVLSNFDGSKPASVAVM